MMRMNGAPLKNFQVADLGNPSGVMQSLSDNGIDVIEFSERLLYSKAKKWSFEDETRIVCPLISCEEKIGPLV